MVSIKSTVIISISSVVLFTSGYFLSHWIGQKRTAYVDVEKVYNEFTMKKELQSKLESTHGLRKNILDSMELQLKALAENIKLSNRKNAEDINEFNRKKNEYLLKQKQFEEDNNLMNQKYTEQVTSRLNQLIKNFGKENNLSYLFGANGNGSLMYANEADDITEDVLKYVNSKYNGI